jgi:asparagine synthetase B (glutamine-hydrolysing)
MCSILGIFDLPPGDDLDALRPRALACSARQRHRGPDWSGVFVAPGGILVHERLAIVDPAGGAQPIVAADGSLALAVNGEIYNHRELREALEEEALASSSEPWAYQTGSDCEVILPLWREHGAEGLARLNGIYAFALLEPATGRWVVARDPVGVIPLYWGVDAEGRRWVASELKALVDRCEEPEAFPPGHLFDSARGELEPFRPRSWRPVRAEPGGSAGGAPAPGSSSVPAAGSEGGGGPSEAGRRGAGEPAAASSAVATPAAAPKVARPSEAPRAEGRVPAAASQNPGKVAPAGVIPSRDVSPRELREALEAAVHRQLMSDVPYGVLLSGGLDSSIVAACAARFARRRVEDDDRTEAWWPRLHSFAIGLEGSPDLAAAERVAEHLGTAHHGFTYTFEEGLDALPDVIRHIETYDVTTIRASTPMFLLARRIRAMGVKMVLSGEGADEVFGGYLYFHRAPNPEAFHEESVRKVEALHLYDCLRANKSMAAWGVEARVPFLDLEFLDLAMEIDPALRMPLPAPEAGLDPETGIDPETGTPVRIEKALLRRAFDGVLPPDILWRQKEQFSDGVGYGWIDGLRAHAGRVVSPGELAAAAERFPVNPPTTAEGYLYRTIFETHFPGDAAARTVPGGPSIACSTPAALAWDAAFAASADPSGRAVKGVHRGG